MQWTTPLGLPVVQPYRILGRRLVKSQVRSILSCTCLWGFPSYPLNTYLQWLQIKTSIQVLTLCHDSDKVNLTCLIVYPTHSPCRPYVISVCLFFDLVAVLVSTYSWQKVFICCNCLRSWLSAREQHSLRILFTLLMDPIWWWLQLPANRLACILQVCLLCSTSQHFSIRKFLLTKFYFLVYSSIRSSWFVLDTCMWCWKDEPDIKGEVCWALWTTYTWECEYFNLDENLYGYIF